MRVIRLITLSLCLLEPAILAGESGQGSADTDAGGKKVLDRAEVLPALRPAVKELLADIEAKAGLQVVFRELPPSSYVVAEYWFDTAKNTPNVYLRRGWQDVDVAHELMHMKLELREGFRVLAWRRDVPHSKEIEAAFGRLRGYVDDQVVHVRLVRAGYKADGEVLKPQLFDSIYTNATRYLKEGRARANDGMAHLDALGHGDLCRATFLVQAELVLKFFGGALPPERLGLAKEFSAAFRAHRAKEAAKADKILALFEKYDVLTVAGHESILREWSEMEGLDRFVGISAYKREGGRYILPWP